MTGPDEPMTQDTTCCLRRAHQPADTTHPEEHA